MMIKDNQAVTARDAVQATGAGIGRAAFVGAILGFFVVLPTVSLILLAAGAGLVSAVAVGAYVAVWGGPGFGAMFGAVRYVSQFGDDADKPARSG